MASAGRILMFPVGDWILGNDYGILDIVYHEGSSYIAKNNIINSTTPPPDDPTNWQIHARGFGADALSEISAEDTSGVLGTVGAVVASQSLIDALAAKVMTELIPYTNIANNFLATDPKTVLSGPMGKSLKDQLDTTNSNLTNLSTASDGTVTTTSFVTDGAFSVKRIAGTVHFTSLTGITLTGTASSGQTLFTLADGFRPKSTIRVPCGVILGGAYTFRELSINPNGSCELQGSSAGTATRLVFSVSFSAV